MNKIILAILLVTIQAQVEYYLPTDEITYDEKIPTPKAFLGYEVGEWHVGHDALVYYMKTLAKTSGRVSIQEYARTYEARPLVVLTITSQQNHQNIDAIKQKHTSLREAPENIELETMPAVVFIGHSIHGNEPSGTNAALMMAYFLAAAQGEQVEKMLSETIILLDPCMNPDGVNRFASWVNTHKSKSPIAKAIDREHIEAWPRGRTNHYWFDLNRDWLLAQHPESRGRVKLFQEWQPHILTDHHEMGTHATYFFQPGVPSRTNPLTPKENQQLTKKIAKFHAKKLDEIGSLYFSEERFDDFYYGKGSTYPDVQGAVGILFEQASSRGHLQESENGDLSFPFTIRNQIKTMFSTLEAAQNLRTELVKYRHEFYNVAKELYNKDNVKAYIVNSGKDTYRLYHFAEMLKRHKIKIYHLAKPVTVNDAEYNTKSSLIIPLNQPQYRLIKSIFEKRTTFKDSIFYDVSSWTMPLAFNLNYSELKNKEQLHYLMGKECENKIPLGKMQISKNAYAYLFEWDGYYAPRALNRLLAKGIKVKVATHKFTAQIGAETVPFGYGTILIPTGIQTISSKILKQHMQKIAIEDGIDVYGTATGLTPTGMDLGSGNFRTLNAPKTLMLVGNGVTSYDAGEVWHLLDQRFDIPLVMVDVANVEDIDLHNYNALILVNGSYDLSENFTTKLKSWVRAGGTIVAVKNAVYWVADQKIANVTFAETSESENVDSPKRQPYSSRVQKEGSQVTGGAIFEGKLDLSHPLAYGYHREKIALFRRGNMVINVSQNPYATPIQYTEDLLYSGYISPENRAKIKETASIVVCSKGQGKIICMADNPNFRAFWYGTNKLFMNAVFFGHIIDTASTERE